MRRSGRDRDPRLRERRWPAAVLILAVAAVWQLIEQPPTWLLRQLEVLTSDPAVTPTGAPEQSASVSDPQFAVLDGCLVPHKVHLQPEPVEKLDHGQWRALAGGGDTLAVDACGSVWAAWFSSWTVFVGGDPLRIGHVSVPRDGPAAALASEGVAAFDFTTTTLWLLGRRGATARFLGSARRWEALPALASCNDGDLRAVDANVYVVCGRTTTYSGDAVSAWRWNESARAWQPLADLPLRDPRRLARAPNGRLLIAGSDGLAERAEGIERGAWRVLRQSRPAPTAIAADAQGYWHGSEAGLFRLDRNGRLLSHDLENQRIRRIVALGDGRAFAAVWMDGLRYFDGERWHAWRYAQGLPSDEGRDLLLDARGRLWLGASPQMGLIDVDAAVVRTVKLLPSAALADSVFDDACSAAEHLLDGPGTGGDVAMVESGGRRRVFFATEQVCPNPAVQRIDAPRYWRAADGALLELGYNPAAGWRSCGKPCTDRAREALAETWRMRWHGRSGMIPLPDPTPTTSPYVVLPTRDGEVWVGTRDAALYHFDGRRWHHYAEGHGLEERWVEAMVEDLRGAVWIASLQQGRARGAVHRPLHRYADGVWRTWGKDDGVDIDSLHALAVHGAGVVAGGNHWLARIDDHSVQPAHGSGRRGYVKSLAIDPAGGTWLVHSHMREGLSYYSESRDGFLTSRDGLFADRLQRVAVDDQQRVWLLADDGRVGVYRRELLLQRLRR